MTTLSPGSQEDPTVLPDGSDPAASSLRSSLDSPLDSRLERSGPAVIPAPAPPLLDTTIPTGAAAPADPLVAAAEPSSARADLRAVPTTAPRRRWWLVAAAGAIGAGLVLRFVAHAYLWLDEAQSVAIARAPLPQLFEYLRQDGAPPLYYLLLHYWIGLFGAGDFAVRALSGVFSVATLPVAWLLARRVLRRRAAVGAVLLLAGSPFALRYATETRMYSLVALLCALGGLALVRALRIDARPDAPGRGDPNAPGPADRRALGGMGLVSGLLLLTHYWAVYALAAVGLWLLIYARRRPGPRRVAARRCVLALAAGLLLFVPWLPSFVYQLQHTGTPWAGRIGPAVLVGTVFGWAGGGEPAAFLSVAFLVLLLLGVAARPLDDHRLVLDLRGHEPGRSLAAIFLGILALPVLIGSLAHQAFYLRYTAVAFVPFLLLLALGLDQLGNERLRHGALAGVVVLGLLGGLQDGLTGRTQGGQVARALAAGARPGDVVAYCPDQMGPSVSRVFSAAGVQQVVYPTFGPADRVNWVDYSRRNKAASPTGFADDLVQRAGDHTVWLAWSPGHKTFGYDCTVLDERLKRLRPNSGTVVKYRPSVWEPMWLHVYRP